MKEHYSISCLFFRKKGENGGKKQVKRHRSVEIKVSCLFLLWLKRAFVQPVCSSSPEIVLRTTYQNVHKTSEEKWELTYSIELSSLQFSRLALLSTLKWMHHEQALVWTRQSAWQDLKQSFGNETNIPWQLMMENRESNWRKATRWDVEIYLQAVRPHWGNRTWINTRGR